MVSLKMFEKTCLDDLKLKDGKAIMLKFPKNTEAKLIKMAKKEKIPLTTLVRKLATTALFVLDRSSASGVNKR